MDKKHVKMGMKVRIESVKGDFLPCKTIEKMAIGKTGVVTAIYDRHLTPNIYPKCDLRIAVGGDGMNSVYTEFEDVTPVETVTAYCYKKGSQLQWFSTEVKRTGLKREARFDHTFEV